ncbi:MAG: hypothetical protein IJP03_04720, partial [Christensenellaceae bacterium]|nr:hypothetical protein [Christensenellaceae bacterium]
YIPTTVIGRQPTGGGTFLEAVNLLQPRRVNCFCADGQSREFLLDADGIDDAPVEVTVQGRTLGEGEYAVDRDRGKVTFVTPPPDSQGLDSVAISFAKTEEGYRERIGKCRWAGRYGLGSDTRIFLSGNPDMPDTDWQSGLYDPTYFPDTGYTCIGKEDSAIMGYAKKYDAMIVVKEDGLFLRTAELTQYSDGQNERTALIFPVKEGVSGVGAIAPYAFGDLLDDPLFLSENGVVGMDTNAVTNQRTVVRRSGKVDARLRREKDLKEAVAAVWKDSYVLCTGGRAYVANGRATYGQIGGSFAYEWSYWENIPARVLEEKDGQLYFGTEDGAVMRFMDPEREGMAAYTDDGKTIYAKWTSPILDGGDMTRYKTVYPKGTGVLLKPQSRSSARLFLLTDRGERLEKQSIPMDIFSFDDVDFGRFTFFTTDAPRMQLLGGTHKRVLRFCLGVENDKANEGFGLCAMTVCLSTGGRMRKNYG